MSTYTPSAFLNDVKRIATSQIIRSPEGLRLQLLDCIQAHTEVDTVVAVALSSQGRMIGYLLTTADPAQPSRPFLDALLEDDYRADTQNPCVLSLFRFESIASELSEDILKALPTTALFWLYEQTGIGRNVVIHRLNELFQKKSEDTRAALRGFYTGLDEFVYGNLGKPCLTRKLSASGRSDGAGAAEVPLVTRSEDERKRERAAQLIKNLDRLMAMLCPDTKQGRSDSIHLSELKYPLENLPLDALIYLLSQAELNADRSKGMSKKVQKALGTLPSMPLRDIETIDYLMTNIARTLFSLQSQADKEESPILPSSTAALILDPSLIATRLIHLICASDALTLALFYPTHPDVTQLRSPQELASAQASFASQRTLIAAVMEYFQVSITGLCQLIAHLGRFTETRGIKMPYDEIASYLIGILDKNPTALAQFFQADPLINIPLFSKALILLRENGLEESAISLTCWNTAPLQALEEEDTPLLAPRSALQILSSCMQDNPEVFQDPVEKIMDTDFCTRLCKSFNYAPSLESSLTNFITDPLLAHLLANLLIRHPEASLKPILESTWFQPQQGQTGSIFQILCSLLPATVPHPVKSLSQKAKKSLVPDEKLARLAKEREINKAAALYESRLTIVSAIIHDCCEHAVSFSRATHLLSVSASYPHLHIRASLLEAHPLLRILSEEFDYPEGTNASKLAVPSALMDFISEALKGGDSKLCERERSTLTIHRRASAPSSTLLTTASPRTPLSSLPSITETASSGAGAAAEPPPHPSTLKPVLLRMIREEREILCFFLYEPPTGTLLRPEHQQSNALDLLQVSPFTTDTSLRGHIALYIMSIITAVASTTEFKQLLKACRTGVPTPLIQFLVSAFSQPDALAPILRDPSLIMNFHQVLTCEPTLFSHFSEDIWFKKEDPSSETAFQVLFRQATHPGKKSRITLISRELMKHLFAHLAQVSTTTRDTTRAAAVAELIRAHIIGNEQCTDAVYKRKIKWFITLRQELLSHFPHIAVSITEQPVDAAGTETPEDDEEAWADAELSPSSATTTSTADTGDAAQGVDAALPPAEADDDFDRTAAATAALAGRDEFAEHVPQTVKSTSLTRGLLGLGQAVSSVASGVAKAGRSVAAAAISAGQSVATAATLKRTSAPFGAAHPPLGHTRRESGLLPAATTTTASGANGATANGGATATAFTLSTATAFTPWPPRTASTASTGSGGEPIAGVRTKPTPPPKPRAGASKPSAPKAPSEEDNTL